MIKAMVNPDSHVYLYAKKWYKRSRNPFNDLRKIYSVRNGIEEKYLSDGDVLGQVASLAYKHITNEYQFTNFIE